MEIFVYKIVGVSPLLQHNPTGLQSTGAAGMTAGKRVYVPADEAEAGVYRNGDGQFVIPTACFRASILNGSKGRKIGRAAARTVLSGCVFPVEENCLLVDPKTEKQLKNYVVHTARVVIGKASVIRGRPMFEKWSCKLALEVDTEMLPNIDILTQVINIAGKVAGVMDFRPNRGGTYGRYTATLT